MITLPRCFKGSEHSLNLIQGTIIHMEIVIEIRLAFAFQGDDDWVGDCLGYLMFMYELKDAMVEHFKKYPPKKFPSGGIVMHPMAFCDGCIFIHPTEAEQRPKDWHICLKYGNRINHEGYHPHLMRLPFCHHGPYLDAKSGWEAFIHERGEQ